MRENQQSAARLRQRKAHLISPEAMSPGIYHDEEKGGSAIFGVRHDSTSALLSSPTAPSIAPLQTDKGTHIAVEIGEVLVGVHDESLEAQLLGHDLHRVL